MQFRRLIQNHRVSLPAGKRGHRPANVPRYALHFLQRHHLTLAIARDRRESFKIQLIVPRNHGETNSLAIASHGQSLENLLRRKTHLRRDSLSRKVIRINIILANFIRNPELIQ